jgi:chemotaxis protein methyltransferase WspC
MTEHLAEVAQLLTRKIGLEPLAVGPGMVARAVQRRISIANFANVEAYHRCVLESETELGMLIDEVIVPESWFFRDERPFRWLNDHVRARWLAEPDRPPLRIASLACSSGEEPYSIAITLLDLGLPGTRFRIDAVDVSNRRLAIARRGVYGPNSFRGSVPASLANSRANESRSSEQPPARPAPASRAGWMKHFRPHESGLELDPSVRATVHFSTASILDPGLLADSAPYDVIFCRNLLIYFDLPSRKMALSAIELRLKAEGFLVIGHADRLDPYDEQPRFVPEADPGSFVYRRADRSKPVASPVFTGSRASVEAISDPLRESAVPSHRRPKVVEVGATRGVPKFPATIDDRTARLGPNPVLPKPEGDARADLTAALERASILANQGMFDSAIEECQRQMRQKGPSAAGYYLMGMIRQAMGDRGQAEECFQKTAYLEPTHAEALLALALLAERRGDLSVAAAYHRRALRAADAGAQSKESPP